MNAVGGNRVNAPAEEIFEILAKTDEIQQRSIRFHVHEEIQVAASDCFAASLRSENTDVSRAVFLGDSQDVRATEFNICHGTNLDAG